MSGLGGATITEVLPFGRGVRRAALAAAVLVLAAGIGVQGGLAEPVRAAGGLPALRTHPLISQPVPQGPANTHGPSNTAMANLWSSANWSGYVVQSGTYSAVTGCWTVPSVSSSAGNTYSSTWIGIDGVTTTADLIQTGTEQAYYDGAPYYLPWWEILPNSQTPITAFTIAPGNRICASVTQVGTSGNWTIQIQDVTTGRPPYITVQAYSGPQTSAEWIVERPELCGNPPTCTQTELTTLADYGQVTFDSASANGANPALVAADGYEMLDCDPYADPPISCTGAPVISMPSNPDAGGNGFSVSYQRPGTAYTALQPYRICDTRSAAVTGYSTECSGHPIGQGGTLDAQVTGVGGPQGQSVPSDAQSVVLNVTAIFGTAGTVLSVFPGGDAVPTASNLNVNAQINQANLAVVALGSGGRISIYNSLGSINVAVDVEGYFAAPSGSSPAGLFHPITPLRI
jgi:hypothetical protein